MTTCARRCECIADNFGIIHVWFQSKYGLNNWKLANATRMTEWSVLIESVLLFQATAVTHDEILDSLHIAA